ncbi:YdeI family protein [uncultured Fluviicola sp.]|uniref:YdeI/OmpD-associated family protein n=1 Tax=uncultured Fluviicola sp. TaxID=463303 RepID=UPI0025E46AF9|nr:YdeI/OmpD-associated family protein [uncultured Fluviicola sp.]
MNKKEIPIFYPESRMEWRRWLEENHVEEQAAWVVFYTKASGKPTLTWSEAVDEALCFGWIDSKKIAIDSEKSHQFFSKRKAKSTWSKINKEKIERLINEGLMTRAGLKCVEIAKQNGSWTILDEVEELVVPKDFEAALDQYEGATDYFLGLSKSVKKMMLYWLMSAKRPETRQKRLDELVEHASRKTKPKQF